MSSILLLFTILCFKFLNIATGKRRWSTLQVLWGDHGSWSQQPVLQRADPGQGHHAICSIERSMEGIQCSEYIEVSDREITLSIIGPFYANQYLSTQKSSK